MLRTRNKILKLDPKFDKRKCSDVVTNDESWIHFFEPQRKVSNKTFIRYTSAKGGWGGVGLVE